VGIPVKYFVQCQVQMVAAHVNPCLLVRWGIDACKVICVHEEWFIQMFAMLSRILLINDAVLMPKPADAVFG